MARYRFGSVADYVISAGTDNVATLEDAATVTCWNAATGGAQHTDLLSSDGVSPIVGGELTTGTDGSVPEFYGPDGVTELYFDANAGAGPRRRTGTTGLGPDVASLSTDLSAHETDVANPHDVTAAQAGAVALTDAGTWLPGDAGFRAWAFDPAAVSATPAHLAPGQLYLTAVSVRAGATLNNITVYSLTAGTTVPDAQSFVGLYDSTGALVASSNGLTSVWEPADNATAVIPLSAEYVAPAGTYYVAALINGPATAADGPGLAVGSPVGVSSVWGAVRHSRLTGPYTALPATITPGSLTADTVALWVAVS